MIDVSEAIAIERPSSFRPAFIAAGGGLVPGTLLDWVWRAATVASDLSAWVLVPPLVIQEETGLSYNEQQSARRKLVHRRFVEENILDDALHLRLNVAEIELAIARALRTQARQQAAEMSD